MLAFVTLGTQSLALDEIQGRVFQQTSEITLSADGQTEFNKFKSTATAFASFYVSSDGIAGAWSQAMFSMAAAEKRAKLICEIRANAPCVQFARVVPRNSVGAQAIPKVRQKSFRDTIKATKAGNFAAFAINGLGAGGNAANKPTLKEARDRALMLCQAESAKERVKQQGRAATLERARLFKCKIIYSIQKR